MKSNETQKIRIFPDFTKPTSLIDIYYDIHIQACTYLIRFFHAKERKIHQDAAMVLLPLKGLLIP